MKKNRFTEKLKFYDELNKHIQCLVSLLKEEDTLFNNKIEELLKQKEGLKDNTDLSPEVLEKSLKELDEAIRRAKDEHDAVTTQLKMKLSVCFVTRILFYKLIFFNYQQGLENTS